MVEPSEYEQDIKKLRAEFSHEERVFAAQKDAEYHDLLQRLGRTLGRELKSFDDLSSLEPGLLERDIQGISEDITADQREDARYYALESLLGGDDFYSGQPIPLSYEALRTLFDAMPHSSDDSHTKELVANAINGLIATLTPQQVADLLELFEDKAYTPADLSVLYLGLQRIKNKSYDGRIESILRDGLQHVETVWPAADTARKKGHTALLPELQTALKRTSDPETKRVVEKAIASLSKG